MDLKRGLSFLIRAKNEDKNIINCLKSLSLTLINFQNIEVIVVDNNSSDKTYDLANNFINNYNGNIIFKLYKYDKDICKVGENNIKNKPSIATYYNWCLEKVTKYNVIKWDADFITNGEPLREMISKYDLNNREDNFALWCTGKTIFEHNGVYHEKKNSYYDEYRVFSKKHNFRWNDYGSVCEVANFGCAQKYRYTTPVFYEIKRTSINEFENKLIHIDRRDREDFNILTILKNNLNCTTLIQNNDFTEYINTL